MDRMKNLRIALWGLVFVVALGAAWLALEKYYPDNGFRMGGDFTLEKADGTKFASSQLGGKPYLMFFGFTHCPEVCPTTLYDVSNWLEKIGPEADRLDVYFVTIDPERDTAEFLGNYLSPFKGRIIGLTGTPEEIDKATKGYHVFYKKVPLDDGDYTMDHTASIFLIRADGTFQGTITWQENPENAIAKIRRLLES
jgi:protein SCO1/2